MPRLDSPKARARFDCVRSLTRLELLANERVDEDNDDDGENEDHVFGIEAAQTTTLVAAEFLTRIADEIRRWRRRTRASQQQQSRPRSLSRATHACVALLPPPPPPSPPQFVAVSESARLETMDEANGQSEYARVRSSTRFARSRNGDLPALCARACAAN